MQEISKVGDRQFNRICLTFNEPSENVILE